MDFLTRELSKGNDEDEIMLDFSKAFDLVPHNRLMPKKRGFGFSDNNKIKLYADDSKILKVIKDWEDAIRLQDDFSSIYQWSERSGVRILSLVLHEGFCQ